MEYIYCFGFDATSNCFQSLLLDVLRNHSNGIHGTIWYARDKINVSHMQEKLLPFSYHLDPLEIIVNNSLKNGVGVMAKG